MLDDLFFGVRFIASGIPIAQVLVTFVPTVALSRPPTGSLNDVRSLAATHPAGLWTAASLDRGPASTLR